jgi:hypothetical protein
LKTQPQKITAATNASSNPPTRNPAPLGVRRMASAEGLAVILPPVYLAPENAPWHKAKRPVTAGTPAYATTPDQEIQYPETSMQSFTRETPRQTP